MGIFGKRLLPVFLIFILATLLILFFRNMAAAFHVDTNVLLGANFIFLITGILVFFMQKKAFGNSNPNVFICSVIAGMMIKMFTVGIAVLAYVLIVGSGFNKRAVFLSLFLYLIYLAAEVMAITKENKNRHV